MSRPFFVSVASLWEIAIKARLGKFDPGLPLMEIDGYLTAVGLVVIPMHSSSLQPRSSRRRRRAIVSTA